MSEEELINWNWQTAAFLLLTAVIIAPMIEEALFRWLPISMVFWIWGKENKFILWPVIIISSVLFGLIHGSWQNIFIQGMTGVVMSMAFLKGGYISSTIAHAVYNFIIIVVVIIGVSLSP